MIFYERSKGEAARVTLTNGGVLDISPHHITRLIRGLTIGSLEGDGVVFLGNHDLSVGSNNSSTVFSGTIQDGGIFNTTGGGTLVKIGTGALTLSGESIYTGGTLVKAGEIIFTNIAGSATGFGPVEIRAGTLAGNGSSNGAVVIGTGSGLGAVVSPGGGTAPLATLSTSRQITFNADSSYAFQLNSDNGQGDKIAARHVVIDNGAQFNFSDLGHSTLPVGTVFTVIHNVAPGKITGAFGNLPDGSTFTSNGNTYKVNYHGGTGNDLTLTVTQ